jgi:Ser/Thr protein kinase RdoA (MazF antagonist)
MPEINARQVTLTGGGLTGDGEHTALVFTAQDGEPFALVLHVDQFAHVAKAAALMHSQARKLRGDAVPPIPVERWGTTGTPERAILSLAVFGGLELRFDVPRGTKETGSGSGS